MAFWHCGEPTCTWTVAAWRLHIPFSLGITVVFSLSADVSQMACYRINCKVALNWSVAVSYVHVLCARLFITWTTQITPRAFPSKNGFLKEKPWGRGCPHPRSTHTQTHTDTLTHPPNAPFWHAVSSHISEENCTSWQWCLLILSPKVNLVKQDGSRIYKYWRCKRKLRPW